MPSSMIFVGLVVLWLLILVPAVARHRQEVARPSVAALSGRVLDAVLRRRPGAGPRGATDDVERRPGRAGRPRRRRAGRARGSAGAREPDATRRGRRARRRGADPARRRATTWTATGRERRTRPTTAPRRRRSRGRRRRHGGRPTPLPARPRRVRPRGGRAGRPRPLRVPPAGGAHACWSPRSAPGSWPRSGCPVLWWAHGAIDVVLVGYLIYLRRQVRLEDGDPRPPGRPDGRTPAASPTAVPRSRRRARARGRVADPASTTDRRGPTSRPEVAEHGRRPRPRTTPRPRPRIRAPVGLGPRRRGAVDAATSRPPCRRDSRPAAARPARDHAGRRGDDGPELHDLGAWPGGRPACSAVSG